MKKNDELLMLCGKCWDLSGTLEILRSQYKSSDFYQRQIIKKQGLAFKEKYKKATTKYKNLLKEDSDEFIKNVIDFVI